MYNLTDLKETYTKMSTYMDSLQQMTNKSDLDIQVVCEHLAGFVGAEITGFRFLHEYICNDSNGKYFEYEVKMAFTDDEGKALHETKTSITKNDKMIYGHEWFLKELLFGYYLKNNGNDPKVFNNAKELMTFLNGRRIVSLTAYPKAIRQGYLEVPNELTSDKEVSDYIKSHWSNIDFDTPKYSTDAPPFTDFKYDAEKDPLLYQEDDGPSHEL